MKGKKRWNRVLSGMLACLMGLGTLSGMNVSAEETETVMGRYLETELEFPEKLRAEAVGRTSDGKLQVLAADANEIQSLWQSSDGGETWEQTGVFPEEYADVYFMTVALSPLGGGAAIGMLDSEDGEYEFGFLSFDAQGTTEKRIIGTDLNDAPLYLTFASDGTLIGKFNDSVEVLNPATGETQSVIAESSCAVVGTCGTEVLLVGEDEVQRYDFHSGDPKSRDEVLNEALYAENQTYYQTTTSGYPIAFAQDEQNRLYYCTNNGIYAHMPDGSVVEQVVDGTLTSFASSAVVFTSMAVLDQTFYVAYVDTNSGISGVMKYAYAADVPSVPERMLTVYSLMENDGIRQAIVQFQKLYPDTYVNYRTGMSGEDGVTAADAMRTLNTEILAGDGPDILILDDMAVDTYAEKGILMDLSELAEEVRSSDGLLENIVSAYADSTLPAIPARFSIEAVAGVPELAGQVDGMASLEALAKEQDVLSTYNVMCLPEILYPVCSGSWKNEDNTIDREKLTEFVSGIKNIYDNYLESASEEIQETLQTYGDYPFWEEFSVFARDSISAGILTLLSGEAKIEMGTIGNAAYSYCGLTSINRETGNCQVELLSLQQAEVFLPSMVLSILNTSSEPQRAQDFVKYMLSKEGQSVGEGFPVNKAAFDEMLINDAPEGEGAGSISSSNENGEMISLEYTWPTDEEINVLRTMAQQVSVCADTERVQQETVIEETRRCINGEISVEEAVNSIMQKLNLYLAE